MTNRLFHIFAAGALACSFAACSTPGNELVILHTNDTHSHIDPIESSNLGGVARRKVLIDSVRAQHKNTLLVDAGDAVQGTLYFHLYKGRVEQQMLNQLGYDIQILGNHEFDNGTAALAANYAEAKPTFIATNYDLTGSGLEQMAVPYVVKKYGKHRVGIFSINIDPAGMIAEGNYNGVRYMPWRQTTDSVVSLLRGKLGADVVVAVTHIGYQTSGDNPDLFSDCDVAAQTSGIDIIIGAHSHTTLPPNLHKVNAVGDSVLVVQTGKYGANLGEIVVNLKNPSLSKSQLIEVNSRLDGRTDPALVAEIAKYRSGIDSLYTIPVARVTSPVALTGRDAAMQNFAADFVLARGRELAPNVDFSITNKGGLRTTWTPGVLTEGAAIDMMPFQNKVVVLDIKGSDLIEALEVMARRGGDALSGLTVTFNPSDGSLIDCTIDPNRTYRIATIDYLATGGDYMTPLTRAERIAESRNVAFADLIDYLKLNPEINPSAAVRMAASDK
jgi:5'-nucleotidase